MVEIWVGFRDTRNIEQEIEALRAVAYYEAVRGSLIYRSDMKTISEFRLNDTEMHLKEALPDNFIRDKESDLEELDEPFNW